MSQQMINLLVVSDESLQRLASRTLIADDSDVTVIGEAVDERQAVALTSALRPDVILLDSRLCKGNNLHIIATLADPARSRFKPGSPQLGNAPHRVLVMNLTGLDAYALAALRAGARGLVLASDPALDLLAAIKTVALGGAVLPPQHTRILMETVRQHHTRPEVPPAGGSSQLTAREQQVLAAIASGWSNADIAVLLSVSLSTVKTHVTRIFRKVGIRKRVEAVALAYESGILTPSR
ncbi:LuxR C-terminal-related transcriptional regulator [Streptomyces sp. NPDC048330]|uniref:LuxR C-terminal-related transcriptional regulator n=1 Tax=Streptomyces sp. NPDC048330 TaxID=3365533 RepID=UPI00370F781E